MEDGVDEIPDSDFFKAASIIFDKIHIEKCGALPSSNFDELIEIIGLEGVIVRRWRVICVNYTQVKVLVLTFAFVKWYVDDEVSMESAEEA